MKFSLLVSFMSHDRCCMVQLLPFVHHINYTYDSFTFPSGMRTYHKGMPDIFPASSEIVFMLSNCEVIFFKIYYSEFYHHDFFLQFHH